MIKKQKHVVYLVTSPLSKRDYNRLGIQTWINRGWEVKIYDFTRLLKREYWEYVNGNELSVDFEGLTIVNEFGAVLNEIDQFGSKTIFIDMLSSSKKEIIIKKRAQKLGFLVQCNLGFLAVQSPNTLKKIFQAVKDPSKISKYFQKKMYQNKIQLDYCVISGTFSENVIHSSKVKKIYAHNFDYDLLLKQKNENPINMDYAIFLDTNEAYHPDYVHLNLKRTVTGKNYFKTMNNGLKKIGKILDIEIIVAAHPRSDYENRPFYYLLPIFKEKTFELIANASLVITHASTATQWAILLKKPIILVSTDEVERGDSMQYIQGLAQELGKRIWNLNRDLEQMKFCHDMQINDQKYKSYIDKYVKFPGSPEKPVWEIVIDRLEEDLSKSVRY